MYVCIFSKHYRIYMHIGNSKSYSRIIWQDTNVNDINKRIKFITKVRLTDDEIPTPVKFFF